MTLVRWNPWSDLINLHSQVDRLFNETLASDDARPGGGDVAHLPIDVRQTDSAFLVEASVPGLSPEEVEVTFDNGVLTIRGQARAESEQDESGYIRRERRRVSVLRQIGLPNEVKPDDISAAFNNGVLTITVPRAEKAQPKRIEVNASPRAETTTTVDQQRS